MKNSTIHLEAVSKIYNSLSGEVQALRNVMLDIKVGEQVAIVGKSGSGKSTLLNIISGIDQPSSGELNIMGKPLHTLNEKALASWRGKNVGIIFQFYHLFPTLSALDNILFAMDMVKKIPKTKRKARATELLEVVGLSDKKEKFPNELSGGEKQRVAIARALANDPPLLIADEPTGNLDIQTGNQIKSLFKKLHAQGKTILVVTHERIQPNEYDRIFEITDGVISQRNLENEPKM